MKFPHYRTMVWTEEAEFMRGVIVRGDDRSLTRDPAQPWFEISNKDRKVGGLFFVKLYHQV